MKSRLAKAWPGWGQSGAAAIMTPNPDPELERLERLRAEGALTEEDCAHIKSEILRERAAAAQAAAEGAGELFYAGFFGRLFMDWVVYFTWLLPQFQLGRTHRLLSLWLLPVNLLFLLVCNVGLVRWCGGSPGKLAMSLRVRRLDGSPVGWREALWREAPVILFWLVLTPAEGWPLWHLTDAGYAALFALPPKEFAKTMAAMKAAWYPMVGLLNSLWILSEPFVLLTNRRRRGLQDFLAGTVVVHTHPPRMK
jgi:uncharacterized RDD family membrane protein YckC